MEEEKKVYKLPPIEKYDGINIEGAFRLVSTIIKVSLTDYSMKIATIEQVKAIENDKKRARAISLRNTQIKNKREAYAFFKYSKLFALTNLDANYLIKTWTNGRIKEMTPPEEEMFYENKEQEIKQNEKDNIE